MTSLRKSPLGLFFAYLVVIAIIGRASAAPFTPLITPQGGYYKGAIQAGLQSPGLAASIYYTTDGSTPSPTHGTLYTAGTLISIPSSLTLQAISYDGTTTSAVASAAFNISRGPTTAPLPQFSPASGGQYTSTQSVTITTPLTGATIYYTTDGTPATASSTLYTAPFNVSATTTVRAVVVKSGYVTSGNACATYTLGLASACATPTFSPNGGAFTGWSNVTISDTTTNAVIRYTTDGTTPTTTSTILLGTTKFIGVTTTLKARAFAAGVADSATASATFTADTNPPTQFNVVSYGASTTSTDNTAAVQSAITAATASSVKRGYVYFPTGIYQFSNSSSLVVANGNNTVIDGQGSTLVFSSANTVNQAISASHCNNFTLENMIITVSPPSAAPGTVTESDSTGFDALLDPGFTAANLGTTIQSFIQTNPVMKQPQQTLGGNRLRDLQAVAVSALGPNKVRVAYNTQIGQGDYLNLRRYIDTAQDIYLFKCDGVTFSNVTLCDSTAMGFTGTLSSDITLNHVSTLVTPGSGAISSTTIDGSHFTECKGLISYQDCQFQAQEDDGINVCGAYYTIESVNASANQITVESLKSSNEAPTFAVGEVIEFRNGTTLLPIGTPLVVKAITQLSGPPDEEQLTLSAAPPSVTVGVDLIASLTWQPRLSVQRCNFLFNGGHGVLVQTPNAVVQNCRFNSTAEGGVQVKTAINPWYEAEATNNVQVLNNSFENCTPAGGDETASIDIWVQNQNAQTKAPAGVHQYIEIADNTIRDSDTVGILASSVSQAYILNNTVENVALNPTNYPYGIYAYNANDVTFNGNTGVQSNYLRFAPNLSQPYTNSLTPSPLNVQPFITTFSQTATHKIQWKYSWNVQSPIPSNETMFVHICNTDGSIATQATQLAALLGDPSSWPNGPRLVSAFQTVDLTSVADGTYTVRIGIYNATNGRLKLLGDDDGTSRIMVGTLVLSGSGSNITFTSQQLDVVPTVSQFIQTGPRQFTVAYTWNVNDTIPANELIFAHLCDSSGNMLQNLPVPPPPASWTPGSQVTTSSVSVTLADMGTLPDGTYNLNVGLYQTNSGRLPLSGQSDGNGRIITGVLTTKTGTDVPLSWNASATNVTSTGNTGL